MFLNGQVLGVHQAPLGFVQTIRTLRRAGRLGEFVSVYTQQECVYIASDGGRVCRPLIICDQGKPRVTSLHTAKVRRPQTRPSSPCIAPPSSSAVWRPIYICAGSNDSTCTSTLTYRGS